MNSPQLPATNNMPLSQKIALVWLLNMVPGLGLGLLYAGGSRTLPLLFFAWVLQAFVPGGMAIFPCFFAFSILGTLLIIAREGTRKDVRSRRFDAQLRLDGKADNDFSPEEGEEDDTRFALTSLKEKVRLAEEHYKDKVARAEQRLKELRARAKEPPEQAIHGYSYGTSMMEGTNSSDLRLFPDSQPYDDGGLFADSKPIADDDRLFEDSRIDRNLPPLEVDKAPARSAFEPRQPDIVADSLSRVESAANVQSAQMVTQKADAESFAAVNAQADSATAAAAAAQDTIGAMIKGADNTAFSGLAQADAGAAATQGFDYASLGQAGSSSSPLVVPDVTDFSAALSTFSNAGAAAQPASASAASALMANSSFPTLPLTSGLGPSGSGGALCPKCGAPRTDNFSFCLNCLYNFDTQS